jgi:aspartyl-tRNA(Asn)/glutamyl-tRNA(Gln) amidotransferase subunit B
MKQAYMMDPDQIDKHIDRLIRENLDRVEQARIEPRLIGWFVGQVMKSTGGMANPNTLYLTISERIMK